VSVLLSKIYTQKQLHRLPLAKLAAYCDQFNLYTERWSKKRPYISVLWNFLQQQRTSTPSTTTLPSSFLPSLPLHETSPAKDKAIYFVAHLHGMHKIMKSNQKQVNNWRLQRLRAQPGPPHGHKAKRRGQASNT